MSTPARLVSGCGVLASLIAHAGVAQAEAVEPSGPAGPASAPAGVTAAPEHFLIQAYDVSGVASLTADEVERLVYPHIGPGRGKDDVEAARKAIQDAYGAKGFGAAIVEVPVQDHDLFAQGVVAITVSEAPVGRVRVVGSRYHSLWVARHQVPALVEGRPVDLKALQRQVAAANRFPDRQLDPQFKPGRVTGEIDVDLTVNDERPAHLSLEVDNDASPATTPLRMTASARYTNLFQAGQALSLTYVVAPQRRGDTEVIAGSYSLPFLGTPWTLSLSGYRSNSNVAALGGTNVLGNGYQIGFRLAYRLPATGTSQSLSVGADFKNFKQDILANGAGVSSAPITYVPMEVQYALSGASEHATYDLALGATFGLRAIKRVICLPQASGCLVADAFQNREQSSFENFVRGNLTLNLAYAFKNDMIAALKVTGQLADSHLITNEQFTAGGMSSVRGYYSSEATGDDGIAPSLELRSPSFATLAGHWLDEARIYTFVDSAFLRGLSPLPGARSRYALIGVGGGLDLRVLKRISAEVMAGLPLTSGPSTVRLHPRVNFQVKGEF